MQQDSQGLIRRSGWALPLPQVLLSVTQGSVSRMWALYLMLMLACWGVDETFVLAQHVESGHDHHGSAHTSDSWEGSTEGVAYSELNHHLAGLFVLLIGFSEMAQALRSPSLGWARMLLPVALLGMATFLLVWSDHEAWPIGSLSFAETFLGNDHEILQHKAYGLLALTVGLIEWYRRLDRVTHLGWLVPLPLFAMIGGMMLFTHSHGVHPSAEKIAMHHAVMGTLAVSAGSSRLASAWRGVFIGWTRSRWEKVWAGLILLIGLQLLFYSE